MKERELTFSTTFSQPSPSSAERAVRKDRSTWKQDHGSYFLAIQDVIQKQGILMYDLPIACHFRSRQIKMIFLSEKKAVFLRNVSLLLAKIQKNKMEKLRALICSISLSIFFSYSMLTFFFTNSQRVVINTIHYYPKVKIHFLDLGQVTLVVS